MKAKASTFWRMVESESIFQEEKKVQQFFFGNISMALFPMIAKFLIFVNKDPKDVFGLLIFLQKKEKLIVLVTVAVATSNAATRFMRP